MAMKANAFRILKVAAALRRPNGRFYYNDGLFYQHEGHKKGGPFTGSLVCIVQKRSSITNANTVGPVEMYIAAIHINQLARSMAG